MSSEPAVRTERTTGTTSRTPLSGAQGGLFNNIWNQTTSDLERARGVALPQDYVAGATGAQRSGVEQMLNIAPTLGGAAGDTMDLTKRIASGFYTNPWNDPNFQDSVTAATFPAFQTLTRDLLPGVQDKSLRASGAGTGPGAYGGAKGGSPQDFLTQRVLSDFATQAQNTGANMANTARGQGFDLMKLVPQLAASGATQALTPATVTSAAGAQEQQFAQQEIDNLIKRYMMQTQTPFDLAQRAANVGATGGFAGGTTDQTTTTTTPAPSMATQILQGLAGGAGIASSMFMPGIGGTSAAGNIASGLRGFLNPTPA